MDFSEIGLLFLSLVSTLVLYQIHSINRRQSSLEAHINRKQIADENIIDRAHSETLTTLNHAYSKEAHAANHLYTRKASHLENAGKILGDLKFWAEKCVVPRTQSDFGTKKEIAKKMSMSFEDLSQLSMQYPISFKEIADFQECMGNLMGCVNYIENMVNSNDFNPKSETWVLAISKFQSELSPLTVAIQSEIENLMRQI